MDYQAIIDELTIERVEYILNTLDIPFEDKGDYLLMPTYCHNHKENDASKKLYFYKNNKLFVCFTECGNMSIFKFLKNYYEVQEIEYDWYNDVYRLIIGDAQAAGFVKPKYHSIREKYGNAPKNVNLPVYNKGVLDCFIKRYPREWLDDHITKEAMDKYNILFSISQNKIIIPHYAVDGTLCGIRGRALNEWEVENVGKYMPVQIENIWYKHPLSLNLYGLYQNKDNIKTHKVCYVFESEKSCLQMEEFSMDNCAVAVCGSQFNKFQLRLLIQECQPSEIIICFDNEEVSDDHKYFNKLWSICEKYKEYCQFSFIYDRNHLTQLKDSPTDRGEEIFKQLLKTRVKIR